MDAAILETRDLSRSFGGLRAVDGVNLRVRAGTLYAIIGPNGAGKTTLLNLLSGMLPPTRGSVFYRGKEITGLPPHRIARLGIGRSFQLINLFPSLSALEHVRLAVQARSRVSHRWWRDVRHYTDLTEHAIATLTRVGLLQQAALPAGALSHGDQRRLELAMLLAQDPDLLLLDEPAAGLSAEQVPAFMDLIRQVAADGEKTIVLVEHNMRVVMGLSDVIIVMHQGRILAEGTPQEIAANETVQQAYLGELYGDFSEMLTGGAM